MSLEMKRLFSALAFSILFSSPALADAVGDYRNLTQAAETAIEKGKLKEAEASLLKASAKAKGAGPAYKYYADSLIELGRLYDRKKQIDAASQKYNEALAVYTKAYGRDTLQAAECFHGLGELYRHHKLYTKAVPWYTKAIAVRRKAAPNHPTLAESEYGLAKTYLQLKQYTEAQPYLKNALAIQEKVYGYNSKKMVRTLFDLANAYEGANQGSMAIPTYKKVIAILETTYGPNNPKVATTYEKLSSIYLKKQNYKSAEIACKRSLAIREKGKDRQKLKKSLNDYIAVLKKQNKMDEAKKLEKRLAAIK